MRCYCWHHCSWGILEKTRFETSASQVPLLELIFFVLCLLYYGHNHAHWEEVALHCYCGFAHVAVGAFGLGLQLLLGLLLALAFVHTLPFDGAFKSWCLQSCYLIQLQDQTCIMNLLKLAIFVGVSAFGHAATAMDQDRTAPVQKIYHQFANKALLKLRTINLLHVM